MKKQPSNNMKLEVLCSGFWVFESYAAVLFILFITHLRPTGAPYWTEGLLA